MKFFSTLAILGTVSAVSLQSQMPITNLAQVDAEAQVDVDADVEASAEAGVDATADSKWGCGGCCGGYGGCCRRRYCGCGCGGCGGCYRGYGGYGCGYRSFLW